LDAKPEALSNEEPCVLLIFAASGINPVLRQLEITLLEGPQKGEEQPRL
jgi:hypothetical protein